MPFDPTGAAEKAFLARPFQKATRFVVRFPYLTIATALLLAAAGLAITWAGLGYQTDRIDLLDPRREHNRRWLEYTAEFGGQDDVLVVVEGDGPEAVRPVLDDVERHLTREERHFRAVLGSLDLDPLSAKGLHYLPPAELAGVERFVEFAAPVAHGSWSRLEVGNQLAGLAAILPPPEADAAADASPLTDPASPAAQLDRLTAGLHSALSGDGGYQAPWPDVGAALGPLAELARPRHFLFDEGRLGVVSLQLAPDTSDNFSRGTAAIRALRDRLELLSARHPQVRIGLTGLPVLENDEMRASERSMIWAGLLSLVGVTVLTIAGFGGLRHALLANAVLLLGLAWSFGYVTLAVGHLNILSMSFAVTLIGIGIDYGIHFVSRYLQLRGEDLPVAPALVETGRSISPAISTGAITTAVAFLAAGFTSFRGVAELGLIAGGGIVLCALAELLVLPAALAIVDKSPWGERLPTPLPMHRWLDPVMRRPGTWLAASSVVALVASLGLGRLWYDYNLLHMQPEGLESVVWQDRLLERSGQGVWFALSLADRPEELLAKKARFEALPSVAHTEEIVSLLPPPGSAATPTVRRLSQGLAGLPEAAPLVPVEGPAHLDAALAAVAGQAATRPEWAAAAERAGLCRELIRRLPAAEFFRRTSAYQQALAADLLAQLQRLAAMADPEPPSYDDLPPALVARFVGRQGTQLLKVYARGAIWDMDALDRFVRDVRSVDPRATGAPLQTQTATLEMKRSYEQAALSALVVIVAVLVFDFRSLRYAALAAAPLAVGTGITFGLLGWLGEPLNPANLLALPVILGLGVDYGVHIVHDFRSQSGRYALSPSTAVAVMIDSLTTIVGFGSLMIASHRGLASLGRVLTIGVAACLFASFVMLPALLRLATRRRGAGEAPATAPGSATTGHTTGETASDLATEAASPAPEIDHATARIDGPQSGRRPHRRLPADLVVGPHQGVSGGGQGDQGEQGGTAD